MQHPVAPGQPACDVQQSRPAVPRIPPGHPAPGADSCDLEAAEALALARRPAASIAR
jgi:hypothetical protein